MNQTRLKEIVEALNSKQINEPCPRCSKSEFSVVGESELIIIEDPRGVVGLRRSNASVPTVVVSCNNCGYLSQHAQAPLGLTKGRGLGVGGLR